MKKYISYIFSGLVLCMLVSTAALADNTTSIAYAKNDVMPVSISAAHSMEAPLLVCETGGDADKCCPYWEITVTSSVDWIVIAPFFPFPVISTDRECKTGGEFKCNSSGCTDG